MEAKIFLLLFPMLLWLDSVSARLLCLNEFILDCRSNPRGMPLDLKLLKGIWHEVARFPKSSAVNCLTVEFPESASRELKIKLSYVSHIGRKVKRAEDTATFPMDALTNNSIFQTTYQMRDMKTFLRYVVVYNDYLNLSLVCGISPITPSVMVKMFSRNKTMDSKIKDLVNQQLEKTPLKRGFMWLDNSNCDRAICINVSPRIILTLTIAFALLNQYTT